MTSDEDDLDQALQENLRLRRQLGAEATKGQAAMAANSAGMAYRLGWVLYWAGCIIGGLSAVLGVLVSFSDRGDVIGWQFILLPFAVVVWLVGRAMRYVLTGD
jgi:hypothetical protein